MSKIFLQRIYFKKKILLNMVPFGFILLTILSFVWFYDPSNSHMEPLIVLLGFVITIIQLLPTAILNAYPCIKYLFELESTYGGIVREDDIQYIAAVKSLTDPATSCIDSLSVWLSVTNKSEETVKVKFIEFQSDKQEIQSFGVGPIIKSGNEQVERIPPGESALFPLSAFQEQFTESHYPVVVLEDGCKIKSSSYVTNDIIDKFKKLNNLSKKSQC